MIHYRYRISWWDVVFVAVVSLLLGCALSQGIRYAACHCEKDAQ